MKHLLLLHGAIGAKDQLQPLAAVLSASYQVHSINFSGHGGEALPGEFSIAIFANDVVNWIDQNKFERADIFGYSMGGYVAMYMAVHYPSYVDKIITLGTKWNWTEATSEKEVAMLNPVSIEQKLPKFAAQLQERHHPNDWKTVLQQTANMLLRMGKNPPLQTVDFQKVENDVLLLVGDRDKMVTLEETINTYTSLKSASLCVLPATSHSIEMLNVKTVALLVQEFIQ